LKVAHIHLIGIGGSGLSAIARVLLENGDVVSGSDRQFSPLAQALQAAGAIVYTGHRAENISPDTDQVIRSSAIPDEHVEVQAARAAGIPVLKRADFLGEWMRDRLGIAIAGTHGKTTTTAMVAWMLTALGQDPTYIIGGVSADLGGNAHSGHGEAFVIEADEYDRMFLGLAPKIAVVTNVEHDHPDCYPAAEDFYQAFRAFTGRLSAGGVLIACTDDPGAARLLREVRSGGGKAYAYGLGCWLGNGETHFSGMDLQPNDQGGFDFTAARAGSWQVKVSLQVPGQHNVRNALAALAVADQVGLDIPDAAAALSRFHGTGRRFEVRGEASGVTVIDDYAHHPTEIRATLSAARSRFPGRSLWAVWQPHTYSRTRTLLEDFLHAFADADHVLVTDIYAAREADPGDFSAKQVTDAMLHADVHYTPGLADAQAYLVERLQSGDVLLVLSAGDADQVSARVLDSLRKVDSKQ
jgi:UDP-N-acetylmuramate--alanine ligase